MMTCRIKSSSGVANDALQREGGIRNQNYPYIKVYDGGTIDAVVVTPFQSNTKEDNERSNGTFPNPKYVDVDDVVTTVEL